MAGKTKNRRTGGSGSVFQDSKGRWHFRKDMGTDPTTGRRRPPIEATGMVKSEARARFQAKITEWERDGRLPSKDGPKTADYFERWMEEHRAAINPTTWRNESSWMRTMNAIIGDIRLNRLTANDINGMCRRLRRTRKSKTVNTYLAVLGAMLRTAKRDGLIADDPMENVGRMPEDRYERPILDVADPAKVIEACEFAETFLKLTPYMSVVLNIDNDHLDYYGSMGELKFAFKRFALLTQFMIFANADDKNTMDVMYTLDRRVRTFGIENDGDYQAVNVQEYKPGFFEFDLKEWSKITGHIRLSVPGRHNIYNALAMCAVCRFVGLTVEQCAEAALNFKGAGRRFEVYGECNGALVVDDYAHHPTELRATLTTAKEMGYKRLIAVHQPFTYSRTKMLFNDFVDVLKIPDITVLTPIMGSREPNDPTITSAMLAAQIPGSVLVNSLQEAADWVKQNAQPGDLVITLGCGDIYKASKMMVEKDQ